MSDLSIEKQFVHTIFCQQVKELDLDSAKKLLADLHLLYLGQQTMFAKMARQDMVKGI
jgi:hypothetical protein